MADLFAPVLHWVKTSEYSKQSGPYTIVKARHGDGQYHYEPTVRVGRETIPLIKISASPTSFQEAALICQEHKDSQ